MAINIVWAGAALLIEVFLVHLRYSWMENLNLHTNRMINDVLIDSYMLGRLKSEREVFREGVREVRRSFRCMRMVNSFNHPN